MPGGGPENVPRAGHLGRRAHRPARRATGRAWSLFYFASHTRPDRQARRRWARRATSSTTTAAPPSRSTCAKRATSCWARPEPGGVHAIFCDSLEVYDARLDRATCSSSSERAAATTCGRCCRCSEHDAGDRSLERAARLRAHAQRAVRGALPGAAARVGARRTTCSCASRTTASRRPRSPAPATRTSSTARAGSTATLTSSRWAASASHLFGRPVTTSETWTWLHSPAFRATPLDVKAEADQHFLSGINQLIGHGWPYSPPQAGKPGWPFYAAAVLSDKNPWWPVMPDLAALPAARRASLLRQGEPVADVALYAPTEDAWAGFRPGRVDEPVPQDRGAGRPERRARHPRRRATASTSSTTARSRRRRRRRYKAIVLPRRALRAGGDAAFPRRLRAGGRHGDRGAPQARRRRAIGRGRLRGRSSSRLSAAVPPDVTFDPAAPEIGFVHRRLADADVYFVANTSNTSRSVTRALPLPDAERRAVERVHRQGGAARRSASGGLPLALEPYGTRVSSSGRMGATLRSPARRPPRPRSRACGRDGR